ncbi:GNAT family N-acetyltransferase [Micromonospora sp. RTP1Z1]|uniref:GNAT family N-acetyltransferase n=1 Tax=Micromonospora sp. RTP1Z1 TaxID=2994043 RepID=UPI0029C9683C|nr:GNAT family N-acetyltransferase [Micromonospora sp. RTP1Z1]
MRIRPATPADLPNLVNLCAAHAAYERSGPVAADLSDRLRKALFGAEPRLGCLVLETIDGRLAGYATFSREFSTWSGGEYLHLDCLFLTEEHRGGGWGRRLFQAVVLRAGCGQMQWQTPAWNDGARRFYGRLGAHGSAKIRYTLEVDR